MKKIGLLICTFNRPNYLAQCLQSLQRADIPDNVEVLIMDDASTDKETMRLITESGYAFFIKKKNESIKHSMLLGCDALFHAYKCDVVINLDSDAIVRPDFIQVLLALKERYKEYIVTGFNCTTKNKNGTVRHKIIHEGEGYNSKASVGGINMCFYIKQYYDWIRPALVKCIESGGNWDHQSCLRSQEDGYNIVCTVPSVVQHIGFESSMGHSAGGEPPDVADDFVMPFEEVWSAPNFPEEAMPDYKPDNLHPEAWTGKIMLENVTLVAADCVDLNRVFKASDKCQEKLMFGDVKIFTSLSCYKSRCEKIINIAPIKTKEEYSWFIMKELAKHIKTSHLLIFQHDGYILNPDGWDSEWLQYDYIGAPWEWYPDNRVGNGGFSLRSARLMKAIADNPILIPTSDGVNTHKEEDHCISRIYRKYLEDEYDIKFAPLEVARKFSIEGWRSKNKTWTNEFGFHGSGLTNIKP